MKKHALKVVSLFAILLAKMFFLPQRAAADDDDPPGRVARLSSADGSVSFEPAGTEDWVTAVVNRPITTGDKLWADQNARAELHLGSASIRMGSNTGFSFLDLNDNVAQLQLTEGTLRIRIKRLERDEIFEMDTPNLAFNITRPGVYRINVNEAGDTTIVEVRDGEGQVTGGGQSFEVRSGETGRFYGNEQLSADVEGLEGDDDFDQWCEERDRREDRSISRRYVAEDAVGYEDLDDYGAWRDVPDYGTIWFPRTTVVGWAPYRYGHWAYIYPWGYTWVDDAPWGFAPFHYGRWVVVGGAWGWVPCRPAVVGVAYVRPVYAPALVAWVGGSHFAIGVGVGGGGAVGWFPLGPREVYVPSYRVSRTYVNRVNITNTTVNTTVINNYYNTTVVNNRTVTNVTYVNQRVPGAVTAAPAHVVATAQPVYRNVVRVNEREVVRSQSVVRGPAVAPERQSVLGAGRAAPVRPPERIVTRQVVARTAPPPPPPRFETQQRLIRENGGRPPAISQVRQIQTRQARETVPVRMAPPARPVELRNVAKPNQQGNRPGQQPLPQNNRPGNTPEYHQRPDQRPENAPATVQPNRPNNERPGNERPNTPPSVQPGRPERPNDRPQRDDRPPSAQPRNERPERPDNAPNVQPNRPNNERPVERPSTPPNVQPGRPERPNNRPERPERNDRPPSAQPRNERPENAQPNRPAPNERPERPNAPPERPNTPPPNVQPNRPNERNERPPAGRPNNPSSQPERQQERPAPPQMRPQPEPERSQPPRQQERPAPPQMRQPEPRQQERPQAQPERSQPPRQYERPTPPPQARPEPPRQQERSAPPPQARPQAQPERSQPSHQPERAQPRPQQQERPNPADKPKDKDKPHR
jgi:hypothetical protein